MWLLAPSSTFFNRRRRSFVAVAVRSVCVVFVVWKLLNSFGCHGNWLETATWCRPAPIVYDSPFAHVTMWLVSVHQNEAETVEKLCGNCCQYEQDTIGRGQFSLGNLHLFLQWSLINRSSSNSNFLVAISGMTVIFFRKWAFKTRSYKAQLITKVFEKPFWEIASRIIFIHVRYNLLKRGLCNVAFLISYVVNQICCRVC